MNTKCAAAFGFAAQLAVLLPIPWGNKPCPRPGITHGKTHFMGHELQSCQRFGGKRGKWPTETAQKLIMAATLQCQKKDYGREKKRKHNRATIIKILLVGSLATPTLLDCPCPVACILSAFIWQINSPKGKPNLRFETISEPLPGPPLHATPKSFLSFWVLLQLLFAPPLRNPDRWRNSRSTSPTCQTRGAWIAQR